MAIKYRYLYDCLKDQILISISKGIDRLPTEQEIGEEYQVSRQTVRAALALLEKEGLIEKRRGSGSYITGLSSDEDRNIIHLILSSDKDYTYPALINDIREELSPVGFRMQVHITANSFSTEREILSDLISGKPGGIIAECCRSTLPNPNLDLYRKLLSSGFPVVFLSDGYKDVIDCPYVFSDERYAAAMLTKHLLERGHTLVAGLFQWDSALGLKRFQGFTDGLSSYQCPLDDSHVHWFGAPELHGLERDMDITFIRKFAEMIVGNCTAVVCQQDEIAYWLIRELNGLGQKVPEDIAVVGFENSYLSTMNPLTITVAGHRSRETGKAACDLILRKLKGLPVKSKEVPWELFFRKSS